MHVDCNSSYYPRHQTNAIQQTVSVVINVLSEIKKMATL